MGETFEKMRERTDTVEAHRKANIGNGVIILQQQFCFIDAHQRKILMRRFAVGHLEQSYEMKFRKSSLARNGIEIDIIRKMLVDKQLGQHYTAVEIYFGYLRNKF